MPLPLRRIRVMSTDAKQHFESPGRLTNCWTLIIALLIVIIAIGGTVIWSRYNRSQPIEISIASRPELHGEVYIDGAVSNPGLYPLKAGDSLVDIIQAAGGATHDADLRRFKLNIPEVAEEELPQKVNINQAEAWLLQALPGIGETRAQAIIAYRQQNGQFHHINELMKVEGIGTTIYDKIKNLITVAD